MMPSLTTGRAVAIAEVSAVVYPACVCGAPFTRHLPTDRACGGYVPKRPVERLGTVAYTHRSRWCRWLWNIEHRVRALRAAHEQRVNNRHQLQEK